MNLPSHVSESVRRRNPHLYGLGAVQSPVDKSGGGNGLSSAPTVQTRKSPSLAARVQRKPFVAVFLISYRRRLSPDPSDALPRGFKHLRDAVAESMGMDDNDAAIRWEYGQIQTSGAEGVAVKIDWTKQQLEL